MPIAKYAETQRKWVEKNPDYFKEYAQWPTWSIKMWDDHVN